MSKTLIKDKDKIIMTFVVLTILFLLVLSKAVYVQIVIKKKLIAYANMQLLREDVIYPKRGNIYDRNGNPLAINIQTYSLFTIPRVNDLEQLENYKKLTKIVPKLNYAEIRKRIQNRTKYTWLVRKIKLTPLQVKKIEELDDIFIITEPNRYYPNHELLSQTLGFVGIDNVGLSGVEFRFDKLLKGNARVIKYLKDAKGRPVKFEIFQSDETTKDLNLSIDKDLQAVAEKYLKEAVVSHGALRGGVGIMDFNTGEVLAMANYPSYDPNIFSGNNISDKEFKKVSFVTDPFEPGSLMKVFTAISALENKISRPNSNYYCEKGRMRIGDHEISEAEVSEKFEWLTLEEIIQNSSNIGITKVAFDVTFPILKKTLKKFNFGEKTGIELPGESRGIFTNKEFVDPLTLSNISFGQGVATTGIQMLSAFAAIANGGMYIRPTILKVEQSDSIIQNRVMSEDVARSVKQMLIKAVEKGTGTNAKVDYFQIAGKTATAQKPDSRGGYSGYISGFIGFPVDTKKSFVIFVYIDNPKKGEIYGNKVAAPVFKDIAKYLLYENKNEWVQNDLLLKQSSLNLFEFNWNDIQTESKSIKDQSSLITENSKISKYVYKQDSYVSDFGERELSKRILGDDKVPNFIGLDRISVKQLNDKTNCCKLFPKGIGLVVQQYPAPGTVFQKSDLNQRKLELIFDIPTYD